METSALVAHKLMFYKGFQMKPFSSQAEMIETHERMFGEAGRICAELICRHVALFNEPLDPLGIRVVLAPVEIGPYNKHHGYTNGFNFILVNRHLCRHSNGAFYLAEQIEDILVHELTHLRQTIVLGGHVPGGSRGTHRDSGWYGAIAEAAPRYLGVAFPPAKWPKLKSVRAGSRVRKTEEPDRITEVEATHWPYMFRELIAAGDERLNPRL
jgi:hypothetical protein